MIVSLLSGQLSSHLCGRIFRLVWSGPIWKRIEFCDQKDRVQLIKPEFWVVSCWQWWLPVSLSLCLSWFSLIEAWKPDVLPWGLLNSLRGPHREKWGLLPTASEEVRLPANGPVSRPYWEQIFLSAKVAKWLQSWLSCWRQPHERCKLIESLGKDSWLQRFRKNIHHCSWHWLFRPSLIQWQTAKGTGEGQLKDIIDKWKYSESFSQ